MRDSSNLYLAVAVILIGSLIVLTLGITSSIAAQDEVDVSNLEVGDITTVSETDTEEEIGVQSSAEIPKLPAAWSAQLEFILYVNDEQVATQDVELEDGDHIDVVIPYEFEETGVNKVYIEVVGELEREGAVTSQSATIERTTETVPINATTTIEGAVFDTPDLLQDDVETFRNQLPQDAGTHTFVLTSDSAVYLVFSTEEPQEGYASVDGISLDGPEIEQKGLEFKTIAADGTEFFDPKEETITSVYENTDAYDKKYVEFESYHRNIAVDHERNAYSTTTGVLVEDPLRPDDLFGSVGESSRVVLDDLDDSDLGSVFRDSSQPRIVTTALDREYWGNSEVTINGIVASPETPTRNFIQGFQEDATLPTDSSTPVLYVVDEQYNPESVSDVSDLSENTESHDGNLISLESNLYSNTISSKRVVESSTGTQLPPIDVVLHGGVVWDRAPDNNDDLLVVIAASSIEQRELVDIKQGEYRITGELVSADRIEGNIPSDSILIAYDLERTGSVDTAEVDHIIEQQASEVSKTLEQQADPDVDASAVVDSEESTDTGDSEEASEESTDVKTEIDTTGESMEDDGEHSGVEQESNGSEAASEADSPGFGIGSGLAALCGFVYILQRRVTTLDGES